MDYKSTRIITWAITAQIVFTIINTLRSLLTEQSRVLHEIRNIFYLDYFHVVNHQVLILAHSSVFAWVILLTRNQTIISATLVMNANWRVKFFAYFLLLAYPHSLSLPSSYLVTVWKSNEGHMPSNYLLKLDPGCCHEPHISVSPGSQIKQTESKIAV